MSKPRRHSGPQAIKADTRIFFVTTQTAEGKALLQTDRMATLFADVLPGSRHQFELQVTALRAK